MSRRIIAVLMVGVMASAGMLGGVGCETQQQTGTAVGAGVGAGSGALIGSAVAGKGQRTEGALIGAGIGALVGGLSGNAIGKSQDKKDAERQRQANQNAYYTEKPVAAPAPVPAPVSPSTGQPMQGLRTTDVILWTQQGVKEDIIIDRIERSGTRFNLTAADEAQLRNAGVSEAVIRTMKARG